MTDEIKAKKRFTRGLPKYYLLAYKKSRNLAILGYKVNESLKRLMAATESWLTKQPSIGRRNRKIRRRMAQGPYGWLSCNQ